MAFLPRCARNKTGSRERLSACYSADASNTKKEQTSFLIFYGRLSYRRDMRGILICLEMET